MATVGECMYCGERYTVYPTPWHVEIVATEKELVMRPHVCSATIAALVAKLKTITDQRDAALAALERFHTLAATLSLLPEGRRTPPEKALVQEAANHPDIESILSARDARMKSEGKVEALESLEAWRMTTQLVPYGNTFWDKEVRSRLEAARKEAAGA